LSITASNAFVGRSAELARMGELLDRAQQGRGGGVFILGEAGAGKSRLIAEARQMAVLLGVRVAGASCLPLTTPLPLDPVHDLLRSLGQPIASTVGESPRDSFRLVLEQVEQATVPGPLLLCVDDMQWSDAATIDLVHYCLARLTDVPLAWLLAARSGRSQTRVVHRLAREGLLDRLELTTLSADETRLLTETKLGASEASPSVVAALYERTGGNPFLCVELLRASSWAGLAPLTHWYLRPSATRSRNAPIGWPRRLGQPWSGPRCCQRRSATTSWRRSRGWELEMHLRS
jgi:predicted ATPase